VAATVDRMVKATLLAAGFHQHKRQWRLRRGQKQDRDNGTEVDQ
jgi:hypothetical protein